MSWVPFVLDFNWTSDHIAAKTDNFFIFFSVSVYKNDKLHLPF